MIYTIAWILWGIAFLAIEIPALLFSRQPGATLSEHIWAWFRVKDKRPTAYTWFLRAVLLAFLTWLLLHLGFGWLSL